MDSGRGIHHHALRAVKNPRGIPHGLSVLDGEKSAHFLRQLRDGSGIETVVFTQPAAICRRRILTIRDPQTFERDTHPSLSQYFRHPGCPARR